MPVRHNAHWPTAIWGDKGIYLFLLWQGMFILRKANSHQVISSPCLKCASSETQDLIYFPTFPQVSTKQNHWGSFHIFIGYLPFFCWRPSWISFGHLQGGEARRLGVWLFYSLNMPVTLVYDIRCNFFLLVCQLTLLMLFFPLSSMILKKTSSWYPVPSLYLSR